MPPRILLNSLRERRLKAGVSVRALAAAAKIDFRKLSLLELGFTRAELRRLGGVLGCQPEDLMEVRRG